MDIETKVEQVIYQKLSLNGDIIALVGTSGIHNGQAPIRSSYPLIVFNLIYGDYENKAKTSTFEVSYQIVCYAYDKPIARRLAGYVFNALNGTFSGDVYQIFARDFIPTFPLNVEGNQVYRCGAIYEFLSN